MYRHGKILKRTSRDPNEFIKKENYTEIILYDKNQREKARAIIDTEDIDKVQKYKWHCDKLGYVISDTNKKGTRLHRLLTNCPRGKVVDHINGNPLDNRKENLRICTQKENTFNARIRSDNTEGYTGIVYREREKAWFAYINRDGKQYSLGYHKDKKDAIRARIKGEKKYFGEYRREDAIG